MCMTFDDVTRGVTSSQAEYSVVRTANKGVFTWPIHQVFTCSPAGDAFSRMNAVGI